ncbi:transglycosylase SLT domain-containing protein [Aquicoccus sp. SCR17]|nr:transglycosylase SLT domain-containing protein [Carideicomes alvinocaridis]
MTATLADGSARAQIWGSEGRPERLCTTGAQGHALCLRQAHYVHDLCAMLETLAERNDLSPGFFARLIWQESRFDPHALSPVGAQGIAQFMPYTAARRGLEDPWNPARALEESARYLGELRRAYGNQGLAAVAYNGGEARADGLVARRAGLARETVQYVRIVTGLAAETWRDAPPDAHDFRLDGDRPFQPACHALARERALTPYPAPPPRWAEWGVQVAFGRDEHAARQSFARKARACSALDGQEAPDMVPVAHRMQGRPGYVMARIGRPDRATAFDLCARLKRAGCACAVYRNP